VKIKSGINSFQSSIQPDMQGHFSELEKGQSPETLFITCSDSRISPNLLTQTQPGEIFVIRNAGNLVPLPGTGELAVEATIQYAVEVLKVKHVVVCGHAKCGALRLKSAIEANVLLQIENLKAYSYVSSAVASGDLELHGWVYDFGSGNVDYLTDDNAVV